MCFSHTLVLLDILTSNASSALCHASFGFVVIGNSVAMWFLLCLEILHFDWLINWVGNWVLDGVIGWGGGVYPIFGLHTHKQKTD